MLYLTEKDIASIPHVWEEIANLIRKSLQVMDDEDYSQPIKPYLRFKDPVNRIIAMPAYLGGDIQQAGIKWIASFPGNKNNAIPRSHSVTVLNNPANGIPECIINSSTLSAIRTAGVSALMILEYLSLNREPKLNVGICGLGPIGNMHIHMIKDVLNERLGNILVYDIQSSKSESENGVIICNTWQEAFDKADIFITCTVSKSRYIDRIPKKGSLHLNVSLRDYCNAFRKYADIIIVDQWIEVCRENTDIENMFKAGLIQQEEVFEMGHFLLNNSFQNYTSETVFMFNPMGLACFDIACAGYYYTIAKQLGLGYQIY